MAFGTGSAIAHRAVGAIANSFGGSSSEAAAPAPAAPVVAPIAQSRGADCSQFQKDFMQCLQEVGTRDITLRHRVGVCCG